MTHSTTMKIAPPKRVRHTYTQRLAGPPEKVFPLLCPVREADWLDGWDPVSVASHSGVAERDCVFVTAANGDQTFWYIAQHRPDTGFVDMIRFTPGLTACRLEIQVRPAPDGATAEITYTHTSLGPKGDAFVELFTREAYLEFMQNWESRCNYYLRNSTALRDAAS
jgi:hypothetical protein